MMKTLTEYQCFLADEAATVAAGRRLGASVGAGSVVYLDGVLGAGKTTLCRGVLEAFGHSSAVKSPTYTLVEPYSLEGVNVFHFDLYRLGDPEELEYMGIRDYFQVSNICLIEWPGKGQGFLPQADLIAKVLPKGTGRALSIVAHSARGEAAVEQLTLA